MDGRPPQRGAAFWPKRAGLAVLIALAGVNIWTGGPVFAVWLGAQAQGDGGLSMGTVFVVVAALFAVELVLAYLLSVLGAAYDTLTGRPVGPRQRATWLRSLRDERTHTERHASQLSALEKMLVASVVLALLAFEAWFFFFAGSSLPRG